MYLLTHACPQGPKFGNKVSVFCILYSVYKSNFVFCILMRPAISFLISKNFQLFVKKVYPPIGVYTPIGTFLQSVQGVLFRFFFQISRIFLIILRCSLGNHSENAYVKFLLLPLIEKFSRTCDFCLITANRPVHTTTRS